MNDEEKTPGRPLKDCVAVVTGASRGGDVA